MADGQIHQRGNLDGDMDHLVVLGHVHEQLLQMDLLLVAGAQHLGLLGPSDGQHRDVVELGVVEAVQQVDGPRTRCGQADAEPARRLGVARGHKGGRLFVLDQYELHALLIAPQTLHDPVDAVAG